MLSVFMQKYGKDFSVTNLDKDKQIATLASGKTIQYDALISTMPLDITLTWLGKKQWADGLTHRCVPASPCWIDQRSDQASWRKIGHMHVVILHCSSHSILVVYTAPHSEFAPSSHESDTCNGSRWCCICCSTFCPFISLAVRLLPQASCQGPDVLSVGLQLFSHCGHWRPR